jgi:TolB protein
MSDYLSSVLDELVPTFADEDGDWARVVADAEAPVTTAPLWPVDTAAYPAAPRRRQGRRPTRWLGRRRLVAVAVAVLLAAFLVTPALGIADRLVSLFEGTPRPLDVQSPTWSRDGRTIVFVSWRDGNGELYAMDAGGSQPRNLTQHPAKDVRPAWSPDGRRIAFVSRRDGQSEIYLMNADGSEKRNLTRSGAEDDFPVWSHDGRRIAFLRGRLHTTTVPGLGNTGPGRVLRSYSYQLYVMNADGSGLRRLTHNPIAARPFVWSPDGRTISMGSYLVNVDGSGAKRLAHIPREASGAQLIWSPDGRRIAFVVPHSPRRPGCCVWTAAEIHVMNADGSGQRNLTLQGI